MVRSFSEIARRIERKEAVVMTAQEICDLVEGGERAKLEDVDVVTTATRAVMSGTYALFSFPVAKPHSFVRARNVWLNGVPAYVGPCPNENLGILDLMVFGIARSRRYPGYGGGHLFRDLVEGKEVHVEVEADDCRTLSRDVTLTEMPHARLFGSRHAFKNYAAFVNPGADPVSTIFHVSGFSPRLSGATFSGCGQINPLKSDPLLEAVGIGTRILLNGAEGFVIGAGTRSCPEKPNLSGFADMHHMTPEYMGGFLTSAGPECICSWAVPIPVISKTILDHIARLDREIPLPVMDVITRQPMGEASYGDVWDGADLNVEFYPDRCIGCAGCRVEEVCPLGAVSFDGDKARWDARRCFHCGICVSECAGNAFRCNMGSVRLGSCSIPVVLRQSDRLRAIRLAKDLKNRILDGTFRISDPVERIAP